MESSVRYGSGLAKIHLPAGKKISVLPAIFRDRKA
jgi:hypothetical protein